MNREHTPSDAADAADDKAHREWWRASTETEFQPDIAAELWAAEQEQL